MFEDEQNERELYAAAEREARAARCGLRAGKGAPDPRYPARPLRREVMRGAPPPYLLTRVRAAQRLNPRQQWRSSATVASHICHEPLCPNYGDIADHNRVEFGSRAEAERAGYRRARNCPPPEQR